MKKKSLFILILLFGTIVLMIFCVVTIFKGQEFHQLTEMGSGNGRVEYRLDLSSMGINHVTIISWSPDNKHLAIGTNNGEIFIINPFEETLTAKFGGDKKPITQLIWSSDSKLLASGSSDLMVRIWDIENVEIVEEIQRSSETEKFLFYSPDIAWSQTGRDLAFLDEINGNFVIRSIELNENIVELDFSDPIYTLTWNEEGILIFTGEKIVSFDLELLEFNTVAYFDEIELHQRNLGRGYFYDMEISSDGVLAAIDMYYLPLMDELKLLRFKDPRDDSDGINISFHDAINLVWSDDGEYLAVGTWNGEIAIVIDPIYASILVSDRDNSWISALDWSSDGQKIVVVNQEDFLLIFDVFP